MLDRVCKYASELTYPGFFWKGPRLSRGKLFWKTILSLIKFKFLSKIMINAPKVSIHFGKLIKL